MRLRASALPLLMVFTLSGCSVLPRPAPPPRYHDFGPLAVPAATLSAPIDLAGVSAPPWLEGDAIWYRFLERNPTRLREYAENRWLAPPPRLFAQAMREYLHASDRPRYRLRLRLARFEQDFTGLTRARNVVLVHATLLDRAGLMRAQKWFQLSAPAAADVSGAVDGLSALGERAAKKISAWAAACTGSGGSASLPQRKPDSKALSLVWSLGTRARYTRSGNK